MTSSSDPTPNPPPPPLFSQPQTQTPTLLGKPITRTFRPNHLVTVANPAGYIKNSSPTAVMSFATSHSKPYVLPDPTTLPTTLMRPPPQQQQQQSHQFVVPKQVGTTPKTGPATANRTAPPVAPVPAVYSASEINSCNDRDKSREEAVVMIHDRKVRLPQGGSGSLYSLCRSWVRNGLPQDSEPNIGDGLKILPKPLPMSTGDPHKLTKSKDTDEDENFGKEELGSVEQLSSRDLLNEHIKHAKRVRARLRKDRHLRIAPYKHRLSLLLPTQIDLFGMHDASPE